MKLKKSLLFTLLLIVIAVGIHIYSDNPIRVENQYSTGIYPFLSRILRYLFGWLPFSFGDVLYGVVVLWLIWKIVKGFRALFKKKPPLSPPKGEEMEKMESRIKMKAGLQNFAKAGIKISRMLLLIYIAFNLFWGINYNRLGIAEQLHLNLDKYSIGDLENINALLIEKVNTSKMALVNGRVTYPTKSELFLKVKQAYVDAEQIYPFLKYKPVSLKTSIWSWVGNYMGFTGYYNPFTGEAQVNTLVPKFLQPFTSCHEVAHQLGYAREMEANFVGYLAGTASKDSLLQYSIYLDLFIYSNRNLFDSDSAAAKEFGKQLIPEVKADLKEWREFSKQHRNPVEPVFRWIYGVYLERNQQPQGVLSYDEVTGFLIAYYKKYGNI